jgi:hypothetical protein
MRHLRTSAVAGLACEAHEEFGRDALRLGQSFREFRNAAPGIFGAEQRNSSSSQEDDLPKEGGRGRINFKLATVRTAKPPFENQPHCPRIVRDQGSGSSTTESQTATALSR